MSQIRPPSGKPKRKAPKTAFPKGKSGNPGGRPAKTLEERTLEAMCKEKTPEALATILHIMGEGEQERSRLAAAQYVIDRGWGKAKETLDVALTTNLAQELAALNAAAIAGRL